MTTPGITVSEHQIDEDRWRVLSTRASWAVVLVGCAASVLLTRSWLSGRVTVDLEVYRAAGSAFVHGRDIYLVHPPGWPLVFTYPPLSALLAIPLAVIPNVDAQLAMALISVLAILSVSLIATRSAAPTWPRSSRLRLALAVCAAAPLLEPVRETMKLGQVDLALMSLVMLDLCGSRETRLRGVLVGLATAIKLTPGVFILYLLASRRSREALMAGATFAASTGMAFLIAPSASTRYWTRLVFSDRRVGNADVVRDQSLRGAIVRLGGSTASGHLIWLVAAGLTLTWGLVVAVRWRKRGDELFSLGLVALTGLLISPISWDHHWVWALPLAVALWRRWATLGGTGRLLTAGAWTATFSLAALWWSRDYHLVGLHGVLADSYVLLGLLVILMAWAESAPGLGPAAMTGRVSTTRSRITPKSAEHHVGRVLNKLGVRSRAEAAAIAAVSVRDS